MGGGNSSLDGAGDAVGRLSRTAKPYMASLARFGFVAKGVVYVIIGVLAALAAFRSGGRTTDSRGALEEILRQPYGRLLLCLVAAGLAGYALWRLAQAVKDTEDKGSGPKGLALRAGYACIAFVYVGLGYSALQLILGNGSGRSSDQSSKEWTARLLSLPLGRWLVGLAGLAVLAFAAYQFYKAFTAKFSEKLRKGEMSEASLTLATRAGQIGLTARGVVFGIVGVFVIQAALRASASEARGLSGALLALERQPYGPWVMGVVALGLVAYGLYMFVEARYRRIVI